jgi:hypothetical protein
MNLNGYRLRYYDQTADKADKSRLTMPLQDGFTSHEWVHLESILKICPGKSDRLFELENFI